MANCWGRRSIGLAGHQHLVSSQIDTDVADVDHLLVEQRGHLRGVAELHCDASEEDLDGHRLHDVVAGTLTQAVDDPLIIRVCRHDDDRRARPRMEMTTQVDPVDVREAEVEQHEVGPARLDGSAGAASIADGDHVEPTPGQRQRHGLAVGFVILDDEDRRHRPGR